jgi:hypothetical protein
MQGVITKVHVLAHPVVIAESYGLKVLLRALFASTRETFLEVVSRCAEEEEHAGMAAIDLSRTVARFIGYERRVGDLYLALAGRFREHAEAARFFGTLALHEEGHALVLWRVRRELCRGRLWRRSRELHVAALSGFETALAAHEEECRRGVGLARALQIVEEIEGSELNVVFDALNGCVDMRSRGRFERFFVLTQRHLAFIREGIASLRSGGATSQERTAHTASAPLP